MLVNTQKKKRKEYGIFFLSIKIPQFIFYLKPIPNYYGLLIKVMVGKKTNLKKKDQLKYVYRYYFEKSTLNK